MEDILDHVEVSIDPQKLIHAIPTLIQAFGQIFDAIGWEVVHNYTDVESITSDNPVIYFDPEIQENRLQPYVIDRVRKNIEFIFPVHPQMILRGHTEIRRRFAQHGLAHRETRGISEIKRFNRFTSRFAYRFIFATDLRNAPVIEKHAALSPVLKTQVMRVEDGKYILHESVFGPRKERPKWNPKAPHTVST